MEIETRIGSKLWSLMKSQLSILQSILVMLGPKLSLNAVKDEV